MQHLRPSKQTVLINVQVIFAVNFLPYFIYTSKIGVKFAKNVRNVMLVSPLDWCP